MESTNPYKLPNLDQLNINQKPKPIGVFNIEGNRAYSIDRPLFDEPKNGINF